MSFNEFDIIEQIFKSQDGKHSEIIVGIGDDAALLKVPEGQLLAVSTDTLVEGVHFSADAEPYDIGFKSLAVNLSDMAAMAAEPRWTTMSLTLPESDRHWLQEYARGFFEISKHFNVSLVGGDITRGPLTISIQIIGCIPPGEQLTRDNARSGDDIYITGILGLPAFALSLMRGSVKGDIKNYTQAFARLNRPEPRVDIAISLRNIANAAIDISDGLAADLHHLITSSGVGADIYLDRVPVFEELAKMGMNEKWKHALNMGDDYELCFTAPEKFQQSIIEIGNKSGCDVSLIGKITENTGITWIGSDGNPVNLESGGFMHF